MNLPAAKLLVWAVLLSLAPPAFAQAMAVTTPRLPPRADAPAPNANANAAPGGAPAAQGAVQGAAQGAAQGAGQGATQGAVQGAGQAGRPAAHPHGAPSMAPVMPARAAAGNCRAQPTPDRQTLVLVSGAEALARAHVPLGEYRAQQVVHSPDGRWAVAFTKLRGAQQYAAMTIDLERCELERTIELNAPGEDVRFDGDDALLRLAGAERRVGLRDGRVR